MAGAGWQFSVTIPSWTQTTLEGDDLVVFYQVEVKVLPPKAAAPPRTRSVLRRFSHFTKLFSRLKEELGAKKMSAKGMPLRRALFGVNRKPEQIERRRQELEAWLWKLIADGEVARSRMLNNFLELSEAAKLVQRVQPSPAPSASASRTGTDSYAMSEGGSSGLGDHADNLSEVSGPSAGTEVQAGSAADFMARAMSQPPPAGAASLPRPPAASSLGNRRSTGTAGLPPMPSVRSVSESGAAQEPVSNMRLGLHVEQRVGVKRQLHLLQQQLATASADLQDAVETINAEQHARQALTVRILELEDAQGEDGGLREAQLENDLQEESSQVASLQQQLAASAAQLQSLQAELAQAQQQAASGRQQAAAAGTEQAQMQEQVQKHTLAAQVGIADAGAAAASQEQTDLQAKVDSAAREGAAAAAAHEEALAAVRQQMVQAEQQSRADKKLLAKEVKSLRKALEAKCDQAASAQQLADQLHRQQEEFQQQLAQQAAELRDARETHQQLQELLAARLEPQAEAEAGPNAGDASGRASAATGSDQSSSAPQLVPEPPADSAVAVSQERAALHLLLRVQQQALREAAALQQRLAACSLEHAASGTAADLQPGQALGVLDTLDGRLQMRIVFTDSVEAQQEKKQHCFMFAILHRAQALMAEALFLAAPSQQAALEAPAEHSLILTAAESDLRQELSGLLVESGELRQHVRALLLAQYQHQLAEQQQQAPAKHLPPPGEDAGSRRLFNRLMPTFQGLAAPDQHQTGNGVAGAAAVAWLLFDVLQPAQREQLKENVLGSVTSPWLPSYS
eukprot:jgi/Astpho2/7143/fgenesh1_pg.00113_%23_1_t